MVPEDGHVIRKGEVFVEYRAPLPGPTDIMIRRLSLLAALLTLVLGGGTSCTTMYDSQGYPVDVITPEGAALAAVAAGAVSYTHLTLPTIYSV